jgi:hypothetical protein
MKMIVTLLLCFLSALLVASFAHILIRENKRDIEHIGSRLEEDGHSMEQSELIAMREYQGELTLEIPGLRKIEMVFSSIAIIAIFIFAVLIIRFRIAANRFDGVFLFMASVILVVLVLVNQHVFRENFQLGKNALIWLGIYVDSALAFLTPALIWLAARMNFKEWRLGFHRQKWIGITFYVISGILATIVLVIFVMIALTPDLGGHWG